jgi:hypothetical protein
MKLRDLFDSQLICNPHKILPTHAGCGEVRNYEN